MPFGEFLAGFYSNGMESQEMSVVLSQKSNEYKSNKMTIITSRLQHDYYIISTYIIPHKICINKICINNTLVSCDHEQINRHSYNNDKDKSEEVSLDALDKETGIYKSEDEYKTGHNTEFFEVQVYIRIDIFKVSLLVRRV